MTLRSTRNSDRDELAADPGLEAFPLLFTPLDIRGIRVANRLFVTPMCQYCADDGHAVSWHFAHHGRFSLSGIGGAMVEASSVTPAGRITPGCLGIYHDSHIEGLRRITDFYHERHIPVGIQLAHSGRKGSAAVPLEGGQPLLQSAPALAWEAIAPSPIAMTDGWPVPREMSARDIGETIEAFAVAAERALAAGFDLIEIHGAHGYLINTFFSPLSNRRDDEWGGESLPNRMRFPLRIAEAIRARIPDEMPLFYRCSSVDGIEGGVTLGDSIELAKELKARGVDVIDCSSGGIIGPSGRALTKPSPGYLVQYAREIRKRAGIATMAVGLIVDPEQADSIIRNGDADLVALGRQLLEDPNFPYHAARALGHPRPTLVLPPSYAFFLERRRLD